MNRKEDGSGHGAEPHLEQEKVAELRQMLESKDREIARLRTKLSTDGVRDHSINPENIIWVFGSGRTGSNWLSAMMGEMTAHTIWQEPRVGALFAFYYTSSAQHQNEHFILGFPYRETWLTSLRSFVLEGANVRFPGATEQGYLVIREPTGSAGAPLLMEALPESGMIFLIRDPRDVVASFLDGSREGGWLHQRNKGTWKQRHGSIEENPDGFVKTRANTYLLQVGRAKQAYEAHKGPKVLVKYENLRADTLGTMKRIYATLEIDIDEKELIRAVEKHAWEVIPEEHKGQGKFHRKASPGGWREDLTPNQAKIVEKITAPLLNEFYPA
ncbi:MAG: sulfotransferase [Actinobacteria bacterium]|nr:sulfotransferase [Actinomycetota bacterium]